LYFVLRSTSAKRSTGEKAGIRAITAGKTAFEFAAVQVPELGYIHHRRNYDKIVSKLSVSRASFGMTRAFL
jgi:hypothetical protein